ncbi:MAG: hypothetical protein HKO95_12295 [Rhodobacteraceae bacterium]|nr:hypothetical protein [Alphaproteobacteria bacterium]MBT8474946.1 hypothetical protein [Alphaproteobacteria bacterium]NNF72255.1 hypothetical protein [Paracoccaceae bacterium]NNK67503.1 hypothetical protein [Paracoccaceae bacterium]
MPAQRMILLIGLVLAAAALSIAVAAFAGALGLVTAPAAGLALLLAALLVWQLRRW